jgi:predicted dehydrogenase
MRLAVIGAGVIGRLRAASIADHRGTELVALADVDRECAARVARTGQIKIFTSYQQMIEEVRPEAVVVSTPPMLHEEMCLFALERGCHVLVEKPMSTTLEGCRRMAETARTAGRTLAIGFNHRFYPAVQWMKQVLREGRIGTVDHFRIFGGHAGLKKAEETGGGCLMDIGIHMTDLARFVAGEIESVYGVGSEDNAMAILHARSGVPISYQSTWTEWRGFHWHVDAYGDRGMVRAAYAPMFNMLIARDRRGGRRRRTFKLYPEIIVREKIKGWETTTKLTFDIELSHFLKSIRGEPSEIADADSGVRANAIAQAIHRSSRARAPVVLE